MAVLTIAGQGASGPTRSKAVELTVDSAAHLLHGLRVVSDVRIDAPSEPIQGAADVEIRWAEKREIPYAPPRGTLLRSLAEFGDGSWLTEDGTRYILRISGWCDFEFDRELRAVDVHLSPDVEEGLAIVLVPNLLSHILVLQGHSVLHASAVEVSDGAIAFVGASGMGKSTVAALCCASGASLVSDDVLRVEVRDGGLWCYRGSLELRLRQQAAEIARRINGANHWVTSDERLGVRPPASAREQLPIIAVVTPRCEHEEEKLEIVRLHGLEAALELIQYPRTLGWVDPEPASRDLKVLTQLASQVPVYRAHLPWGPPFQPDLGEKLLDELHRLGLAGQSAAEHS